ncbi:hypothetical protein [Pseudomonas sp. OTU5201]|uniref:hypothetical protein n=1 Tax=Pseudomonas sp. OTU5201 TaxID=3043850 RepID=UPI00313CE1E6
MAAGIAVSCLIIVAAVGKLRLPSGFIKISILLFLVAFVVHTTYYAMQGDSSLKHALSVMLLTMVFFCAGLLSVKISGMHGSDLINVLYLLAMIIVFFGFTSLVFPASFLNYSKYAKSIFPFSEPSHYAITVGGILLAAGFYLHFLIRGGLVLSVLFFALVYPSTLLLLLVFIMLFSYYVRSFVSLGIIVFFMVVLGYLILYYGFDVSYYEDRLSFDESTSNLTALVYMQGWESAYRALLHTNWIGLGFQNMGSLDPGVYGERIFQIVGIYKNREDGGFLAAKIIGEFGVFGLAFLLFYVIALCSSILYNRNFLKAYQEDRNKALELFPVSSVLGCSLIVAFSIEVFARGYGYFSPGILLAMVSIFLVTKKRKSHSCRYGSDYA